MSKKTVTLEPQEVEYLQSFVEAQSGRLMMLAEEQLSSGPFAEESKILDILQAKLA